MPRTVTRILWALTIVFATLWQLPSSTQAQIVTIAPGPSTPNGTSGVGPTNIFWRYRRMQFVITAAEINSTGAACGNVISGIAFNHFAPPIYSIPGYTIAIKHTTATNAATFDPGPFTTVYTNPNYTPPSIPGWEMLFFQTNFNWNGTSNLCIDVCWDQVQPTFSSSGQVQTSPQANGLIAGSSDFTVQCGATVSSISAYRPDVQLFMNSTGPFSLQTVSGFTASTLPVLVGATNAPVIRATFTVCGTTGTAFQLNSITFNTSGSTNPATDITAAKVFYTGNNLTFAPTNQVGTAVANPNGTMTFTPASTFNLASGPNHFWLAYDIPFTATNNNVVDGQFVNAVVSNVTRTPLVSNPAGNRPIVNPYATLPYSQNFDGVWLDRNATRDVPSFNFINTPATGANSWRRSDDGVASGAWPSNTGAYTPLNSNAGGAGNPAGQSARFNTWNASSGSIGRLDLFLNFNTPGTKVLDYDHINIGGNDVLRILLSTDGGVTFNPIATEGVNLAWTRREFVGLGNSTSQQVVLRFEAESDFGANDIGLDNIFVRVLPPIDLSCVRVLGPQPSCALGTSERVSARFRNLGSNVLQNLTVSYRFNGGSVVTETINNVNLSPLATYDYTFNTTINAAVSGYYDLEVFSSQPGDGQASNDQAPLFQVISVPTVSTFPYSQNFNANEGFWRPGGVNSTWAWGQPQKSFINFAASAPNCWVTGGLGTGFYNNDEFSVLQSPCFDFSNLRNPVVAFSIWWRSQANFDGLVLQGSTDGGQTWQRVGNIGDSPGWNWYNSNIQTNPGPGGQNQGWSGSATTGTNIPFTSNGWVTAINMLTQFAGKPSVILRFAMATNNITQFDGFAIDNFIIREGTIFSLGPDRAICQGDSVTLSGPVGQLAYSWNDDKFTTTRNLVVKKAGTYILRVTDNNTLFAFDTVVVRISEPNVPLGPNRAVCANVVEVLNVTNPRAQGYLWSDGFTQPIRLVTTPGVYTVTVTDSLGCRKTGSVRIDHNPVPTPNLGNDTTFCAGSFASLDAGAQAPGSSYFWNTGATSQRVFLTSPGKYWVNVISPDGCTGTDTVQLGVLPSPVVNLGPDIFQCSNLNVTLDAGNLNPGTTYLWNNGATSRTLNVTQPGIYWVTVRNSIGCSRGDTIVVGANPNLAPNLGPDVTVCGNAVIGTTRPATAYLWNNGATTRTISVTQSGRYILQLIDAFGCIGLDTIFVTVAESPNANISSPDTGRVGEPVFFADGSLPVPTQWRWEFNDGFGSTSNLANPVFTYNFPGIYTVKLVVEKNGCRDSITKDILILDVGVTANNPAFARGARLTVFPNPASEQFQVRTQLPTAQMLRFELISSLGQVVWSQTLDTPTTEDLRTISVSQLAAGTYTLNVRAGDRLLTERVILR